MSDVGVFAGGCEGFCLRTRLRHVASRCKIYQTSTWCSCLFWVGNSCEILKTPFEIDYSEYSQHHQKDQEVVFCLVLLV